MSGAREIAAAVQCVQGYMDGLFDGDSTKLEEVFHPAVRLQSVTDGELTTLDLPAYLDRVAGRLAPAAMGQERSDAILSIEINSPTTGHAVASTQYGNRSFVDLLTLVWVSGRWWIISKTWHYVDLPN